MGYRTPLGKGRELVIPNPKMKLMDQVREVVHLGKNEHRTPNVERPIQHRSLKKWKAKVNNNYDRKRGASNVQRPTANVEVCCEEYEDRKDERSAGPRPCSL